MSARNIDSGGRRKTPHSVVPAFDDDLELEEVDDDDEEDGEDAAPDDFSDGAARKTSEKPLDPDANENADLRLQISILQSPTLSRSDEQLAKLAKSLSEVALFKSLDPSVSRQLCNVLELERVPEGATVLSEGDCADKFYVILNGSVGVYQTVVSTRGAENRLKEEMRMKGMDCQMAQQTILKRSDREADEQRQRKLSRRSTKRGPIVARATQISPVSDRMMFEIRLREIGDLETKRKQILESPLFQKLKLDGISLGRAKTIDDLVDDMIANATELAIDDAGAVYRKVHLVTMKIHVGIESNRKYLTEVVRIDRHGQRRRCCHLPVTRKRPNETAKQATSRCLSELSGLSEFQVKLQSTNVTLVEDATESSADALRTVYYKEVMDCELADYDEDMLHRIRAGLGHEAVFELQDKSTTRFFSWLSEHVMRERGVKEFKSSSATGKGDARRGKFKKCSLLGHYRIQEDPYALRNVTYPEHKHATACKTDRSSVLGGFGIKADRSSVPGVFGFKADRGSLQGGFDERSVQLDATVSNGGGSVNTQHGQKDTERQQRNAITIPIEEVLDGILEEVGDESASDNEEEEDTSDSEEEVIKEICLQTLYRGGSFGEKTFIGHSTRPVAIRTLEDAIFGVITKDAFDKTLAYDVLQDTYGRADFLSKVPLLTGVCRDEFEKLAVAMNRQYFRKSQVVYDQNSVVMHVYFVINGRFSVFNKVPRVTLETDAENQLAMTSCAEAHQSFGLSAYLRGEKRYGERVICSSGSGALYYILAQDLVSYFPSGFRRKLQDGFSMETLFAENRAMVMSKLNTAKQSQRLRKRAELGARCWPQPETDSERLQRIQLEAQGLCEDKTIYSVEGRVNVIGGAVGNLQDIKNGQVYLQHEQHQSAAGNSQTISQGQVNDEKSQGNYLLPCWSAEMPSTTSQSSSATLAEKKTPPVAHGTARPTHWAMNVKESRAGIIARTHHNLLNLKDADSELKGPLGQNAVPAKASRRRIHHEAGARSFAKKKVLAASTARQVQLQQAEFVVDRILDATAHENAGASQQDPQNDAATLSVSNPVVLASQSPAQLPERGSSVFSHASRKTIDIETTLRTTISEHVRPSGFMETLGHQTKPKISVNESACASPVPLNDTNNDTNEESRSHLILATPKHHPNRHRVARFNSDLREGVKKAMANSLGQEAYELLQLDERRDNQPSASTASMTAAKAGHTAEGCDAQTYKKVDIDQASGACRKLNSIQDRNEMKPMNLPRLLSSENRSQEEQSVSIETARSRAAELETYGNEANSSLALDTPFNLPSLQRNDDEAGTVEQQLSTSTVFDTSMKSQDLKLIDDLRINFDSNVGIEAFRCLFSKNLFVDRVEIMGGNMRSKHSPSLAKSAIVGTDELYRVKLPSACL